MFMTFEHIENEVIQAKSTHLFVLLKLHTKSPHSVGVPHTPEPLFSSHCRYVYPPRLMVDHMEEVVVDKVTKMN